jgi:hypothetical protein
MSIIKTKGKKSIKMQEIKRKAISLGITPGNMDKIELIRAIQTAEGNRPCFGTSNGQCIYTDCCFMGDCFKIRA